MKADPKISQEELTEKVFDIADQDFSDIRYKDWLWGTIVAGLSGSMRGEPESDIVIRAGKLMEATIRGIAIQDLMEEKREEDE